MEAIAKEIRSGKQPLITVADDLNSEYIHSDITAVGTFAGLRIL